MNKNGREEAKKERYDVVVAGGGMAGICAALASARHGARTALIQDRPVLGGNSSSEMRVWMVGATAMGKNRYAAETGIIGELDMENLYRNPEGNCYVWDSLLLDAIMQEQLITLYLNTTVLDLYGRGEKVESILAYQMTTETWIELQANFFVDCTGDGRVGFLAGVPFLSGQEAEEDFGESMAPKRRESFTLGSTILLYTRDAGHTVHYQAPKFAFGIEEIHRLITENKKPLSIETNGCDFWWIETGGEKDSIRDGEEIRLELQRLVYGIWNYIKNSGHYPADNLELEWVGSLPARRESRRMRGAYILKQQDIVEHRRFDDAVCSGGWPIDTHPPGGIYSAKDSCLQRDAGIYQVPLRCLYAQKPDNLFFAGRNLSATHLAFASARVMKTCAGMGQAAGTAAALCNHWRTFPAGLTTEQISRLQQILLWDDQWIFGLVPKPTKKNRLGKVLSEVEREGREIEACHINASGYSSFENTRLNRMMRMEEEAWIMLPSMPSCRSVLLWMRGDRLGEYRIECLAGTARYACEDMTVLGIGRVMLKEKAEWVEICFDFNPPEGKELYLRLPIGEVELGVSDVPVCGCIGSIGSRTGMRLFNPCFVPKDAPDFFAPEHAFNGFGRPESAPNQWMSAPLNQGKAWLECELESYPEENSVEMCILFDNDLNRDYNQLRPDYYKNGWNQMPTQMVRSFRILVDCRNGDWRECFVYKDWYQRRFCGRLFAGARRVRLEVDATWGAPCAAVFSVRFCAVKNGKVQEEKEVWK